ncbi:membrane protein insertion efficiency factor YidD [Streptomyces sp. NPDC002553]|uniref:membrane protein insertion efficiency factor YidD n=1 Tax=Streptomyces sp. NPDC002553 TaxID=3154417 RepID=UPI0033337E08
MASLPSISASRGGSKVGKKENTRNSNSNDTHKEGCISGWLDTYVGCSRCCPAAWLVVLAVILMHSSQVLSSSAGNDPAAPLPAGWTARKIYGAVRYYREAISPTQPARCTYKPSCSTYAVQALHRHGALRGTFLLATRLLRCRPGVARRRGYHDPVPH